MPTQTGKRTPNSPKHTALCTLTSCPSCCSIKDTLKPTADEYGVYISLPNTALRMQSCREACQPPGGGCWVRSIPPGCWLCRCRHSPSFRCAVRYGRRPCRISESQQRYTLHFATAHGNLDAVQALLQSEVTPNQSISGGATEDLGKTPLMLACQKPCSEAVRRLVALDGIDPILRDNKGHTALFFACSTKSDREEVDAISSTLLSTFPSLISEAYTLSNSDSPFFRTYAPHGETALLQVCKGDIDPNTTAIAELLLTHGSDPSVRDPVRGRTPFLYAIRNFRVEELRYRQDRAMAAALGRFVASDPTFDICKHRDNDGGTALMLAAKASKVSPTFEFILALPGIDAGYCNAEDHQGRSALMCLLQRPYPGPPGRWSQADVALCTIACFHYSKALVYAFSEGTASRAEVMLSELSNRPQLGGFVRRLDDFSTIVLLVLALRRNCKILAEILLAYCEDGPVGPVSVEERWRA